ncbi:hypothetical protein BEN47_03595 [Hymenobacter lapidarius]|uniref:DUF1905 domain-containing protein n=1 Tax=Hymenobacter lapidarius TaxID=1908237 RepID=A0A1G1SXN1_9BACT|nr:YdeI/OmpD-associated family protein [Hymenobacter lapidarius]OGX83386.1 hypothetical protein BEN47_03595 [Hymenobacter lapidarius]
MLELFNAQVILVKFPGKGGWTYAPVGELPFKPKTHFGVLKVRGRLDEVALDGAHLMPMGKGARFLPVNAALRKKLGKQAGDTVHLQLFAVEEPTAMTVSLDDFVECLADAPAAFHRFEALAPAQQRQWLGWVAAADTEEQQVARVETAVLLLAEGGKVPLG